MLDNAGVRRLQGDRIRKARHRQHLSLQTLADTLGVSVQAISAWELGHASPVWAIQIPLCRALDTRWSWIFYPDLLTIAKETATP